MQSQYPDPVKTREIGFHNPHPDPQQALSAVLALSGIDGILNVSALASPQETIQITYDLNHVSLMLIEALLTELGFHLDNSLLAKLKRALYNYTEQNELENLAANDGQDHTTRDVFMQNYCGKLHGCRDERPDYWRKYL